MLKKSFLAVVTLILVAAGGSVSAKDKTVEKIIEEGKSNPQVGDHLDILTGRFGGRLIGSSNYDDAANWLLHKYSQWGIPARKEEAGEVPVGFNRDHWSGRAYGVDGLDHLHFVTPSYTSGTHGRQIGHVLPEPRTKAEFDRMHGKLKGAWVLLTGKSTGFPIDKTAKGDSLRAVAIHYNDSVSAINRRRMMNNRRNGTDSVMIALKEEPALYYHEMCDAGVLGFIQAASTPLRALYDRPLVNDPNTNFDNLPTQPEIKLDEHQFALIERAARERRDILLEFDIRNHFRLGPVKYHSVIAEIKGSKYPDEYVIISGHLDAYDVGTGAVDCGTGIAPMLEAARLLSNAGAKPKRTIRFVAFAGEEFGLLGAQAYVKKHKNELGKISNLFNRDGGPEPPVGISVPAAMLDDFKKICEPIAGIDSTIPFEVTEATPRPKPTKFGGTDATVFAVEGVPTIGFRLDDVDGTNFNYGEIWHTENDILNRENPRYQQHAAMVTAIVALGVANLDHQLSREGLFSEEKPSEAAPSK